MTPADAHHFAQHPSHVVRRALAIAIEAHAGQVRRYTHEPFVTHPVAVAQTVRPFHGDPLVLATALLHDVVEDTPVTAADLDREMPSSVVRMVLSLTNPSSTDDGDRAARKRIDHDHVARAEPRAQTIKYADVWHNVRSIARHDPEFAPTYLAEKISLIHRLDRGHPVLRRRVWQCLVELTSPAS
ncbi:HD domain-containing protein [Guyparkeria halophila]|uniref:HD domain-containing protein n=1 Tax=Guyparkeria halophila TaxID=47960 RepID=A0A6I6D617_9GAMM|nr:HD domain-containing protein [Guyparkeria halophila]QGT78934.1 HD domain-containing protein [Guyparkeria halophila]